MRKAFDRLRDELQKLREAEQPDFEDAELMSTDEFGNVEGYEPTKEERKRLSESSVQKRLLDKVAEIIDRVEAEHRTQLRNAFAPPFLYRHGRSNRRYGYFYIGEKSTGKTGSRFRESKDLIEYPFTDLEFDDYDWIVPKGRGD